MIRNQFQLALKTIQKTIQKNYKTATENFLFTAIFVNLFQMIFGAENSIVGVAFAIIMPASMLLDLAAKPVKNFFSQFIIMEAMTIASFLVGKWNPYGAIPINLIILFFLLYFFTFEYAMDLYMPYLLSYLFLVFISPITLEQLPKRMISVFFGSACIICYHLVKGNHRMGKAVSNTLTEIIEEVQDSLQCLLSGKCVPNNTEVVHNNLCKLSHLIYERRNRALHISDAALAMLDCGLILEDLNDTLYNAKRTITPEDERILEKVKTRLNEFHTFIQCPRKEPTALNREDFSFQNDFEKKLYQSLERIQDRIYHMKDENKQKTFQKTSFSKLVQIKGTIQASPVRFIYSLRIAILLTILTALVQILNLPHGKWLLFTVASVSLPYADDVGNKAKKRLWATLAGGCASVIAFSCIPSMTGRTIVMLAAGYISSYLSDYRFTFACSTVGALGGAVLMNTFGWESVGNVFMIRLGYICAGIIIAYIANCIFFPFKRQLAMGQLKEKYLDTIKLLVHTFHEKKAEPQLYYSLIMQALLQEEKLQKNMTSGEWKEIKIALESITTSPCLLQRS
ncbi:MAG: FUSC family protein [Acetivibrio sp.]